MRLVVVLRWTGGGRTEASGRYLRCMGRTTANSRLRIELFVSGLLSSVPWIWPSVTWDCVLPICACWLFVVYLSPGEYRRSL